MEDTEGNYPEKKPTVAETDLPYRLRISYYAKDGIIETDLIPGRFREPKYLYGALSYFLDMEIYELLAEIIDTLKLSTHDRLIIVYIVILNNSHAISNFGKTMDWRYIESLELVNMVTGEVIDSVESIDAST